MQRGSVTGEAQAQTSEYSVNAGGHGATDSDCGAPVHGTVRVRTMTCEPGEHRATMAHAQRGRPKVPSRRAFDLSGAPR